MKKHKYEVYEIEAKDRDYLLYFVDDILVHVGRVYRRKKDIYTGENLVKDVWCFRPEYCPMDYDGAVFNSPMVDLLLEKLERVCREEGCKIGETKFFD